MRALILLWLLLCLLPCTSCAAPIAKLWPPKPGARTHRITVAVDGWHSVVGVTEGERTLEWGYADRHFYLERNDGCSGSCGALFWPTAGVLRVARPGLSIWDTRLEPARRWEFELSEAGYKRLVAFLKKEKAEPVPVSRLGQSEWFASTYSYQAFHHCNHWTTRALREAGLPVWSWYSLFRWSFVMQMDRAAAIAEELAK